MKRLWLFLLCLPLFAQGPTKEWIAKNAVRLETPQAGDGFADMAGIRKIVGNARIVSLGEATHGTREFFQLKHRMLEYLAAEMGFTIFSIEANMPEAYRLNDYVLNGKGDPAQLLRGMYFWTWDTEEVLDMIKWMRAFNQSGKGRVQFTGFDMQTPTVALQIVRDFAGPNDEKYAESEAYQAAIRMALASPRINAFGVATGTFPIEEARGRKVKFSGWIKTEAVTRGYAGLWWRVDGPEDPTAPRRWRLTTWRAGVRPARPSGRSTPSSCRWRPTRETSISACCSPETERRGLTGCGSNSTARRTTARWISISKRGR